MKPVVVPSGPKDVRLFAIGDIHGRADLLGPLLFRLEVELSTVSNKRSMVIFLGDLIDRGPASKQVIQIIAEFSTRHPVICLMGNHESLMLEFLDFPQIHRRWLPNGGLQTLASFGIENKELTTLSFDYEKVRLRLIEALGKDLINWFRTLPTSLTYENLFFAHAGVRPKISLERQVPADLLWIGQAFLDWPHRFGKYIIHGHTPVDEVDIRDNRANIDTGAYATNKLSCLEIDGADWAVISANGTVAERRILRDMPAFG